VCNFYPQFSLQLNTKTEEY